MSTEKTNKQTNKQTNKFVCSKTNWKKCYKHIQTSQKCIRNVQHTVTLLPCLHSGWLCSSHRLGNRANPLIKQLKPEVVGSSYNWLWAPSILKGSMISLWYLRGVVDLSISCVHLETPGSGEDISTCCATGGLQHIGVQCSTSSLLFNEVFRCPRKILISKLIAPAGYLECHLCCDPPPGRRRQRDLISDWCRSCISWFVPNLWCHWAAGHRDSSLSQLELLALPEVTQVLRELSNAKIELSQAQLQLQALQSSAISQETCAMQKVP